MSESSDYSWILEGGLQDAACLTAVVGAQPEEVLLAIGADLGVVVDEDDAFDEVVSVTAVPGGVVVVEPNGFQGSRPEVLVRLAAGRRAASMFWNVNALNAFSWVDGSDEVGTIEMLPSGDRGEDEAYLAESGLPEDLHAIAMLASDDGAEWEAVGVAMVAAFTGVPVPRDLVEAPDRHYRLRQG